MITVKMFKETHKEIFHFQDVHKFNEWLNLHWKKFDYFEYNESKNPKEKIIFKSKNNFENFYKRVKK